MSNCKTIANEANDPVFQKPSKVYLIQGFVFLIIAIALLVFGLWASSTGGIVFVGLGVFVFVIAVVSFNEHKKVVHKHHLANADYAAYEEYIKNEREKERETQEFLQKQKDEKEAKKYNNYKYKCPMCGSNKIANISTAKKVVSAEILGLASAKIGKTYQCDECKYRLVCNGEPLTSGSTGSCNHRVISNTPIFTKIKTPPDERYADIWNW